MLFTKFPENLVKFHHHRRRSRRFSTYRHENCKLLAIWRTPKLLTNIADFWTSERCKGRKSDRSHQELFNKILFLTSIQCYSLANIGFDTVENEHSKVAIVI